MQSMKHAIMATIFAATLLPNQALAGPANIVYTFDSYYQEHASRGPDFFPQYYGPLTLIDVVVNWSGTASSSYSSSFGDPNAPPFLVPYSGGVGFIIYETGDSASVGGSGASVCTDFDCQVGISGGGVAHFNPAGYVGSGWLTISSTSSVDPHWDSTTQSGGFSYETLGTVTYVLGVPEPASWAMLLAGFGLVGGVLRARPRRSVLSRTA